MSVVEQPKSGGLAARIQGILLHPKTEWDVIDGESATVQGLFVGYACILAAIPAVAGMIGELFPVCFLGFCVHFNPLWVVVGAVVRYALSLGGVFITALIIDGLAPSFGGQKNPIQAMKVAVYSSTAAWLAGIFAILPALALLSLLGLYSLYLLYLGLPRLTKAPQDKALGYTIVVVLLSILVMAVVYAVGGAVTNMGRPLGEMTLGAAGPAAASVSVNGSSVDLGKAESAAAAMAASAQALQSGQSNGKAVAAVDPDKLKSLLPDSLSGMARTELSAAGVGAGGMASSHAEAVYAKGDERVTLKVTDLAAMGPMAAMAGAMGLQASKQTATGYEKTSTVNGRLIVEKWDNASRSGEYTVIVANRFAVEADGAASSIDVLKGAVAAVGPDRLEGLAKA